MAAARRYRPLTMAIVAIIAVFSAGLIGNLATLPNIPTWYAGLIKPSFNPPNWLFGPVWGLLYVMIAYSFWRILTLYAGDLDKRIAIFWFTGQMIFNAAWSVVFFGLHSPLLGLVVIAAMIVTISITIARFYSLDRIAGLLLAPYLMWAGFASVLNAAIWWLNR
jgi:translocator protein